MSLHGIFSSRSQRRTFLLTSCVIILALLLLILIIAIVSPDTRGWNLLLDVFVGLSGSAIFVIIAALYVKYFFEDPHGIAFANKLLPVDIGPALVEMATTAQEYKLFVRTGRHFRADILPILVDNATRLRRRIEIDVILLDFRNDNVCEKYALYRKSSSSDGFSWSRKYVQEEILATILKLLQANHDHPSFIGINLYLTSRLSTFRFDASQEQIIVTREDPKDIASRYRSSDSEFSAYLNEFNWSREEACVVEIDEEREPPIDKLREIFSDSEIVAELKERAAEAMENPSPYAR